MPASAAAAVTVASSPRATRARAAASSALRVRAFWAARAGASAVIGRPGGKKFS